MQFVKLMNVQDYSIVAGGLTNMIKECVCVIHYTCDVDRNTQGNRVLYSEKPSIEQTDASELTLADLLPHKLEEETNQGDRKLECI